MSQNTDSSVNKDRIVIRQIQCSEADHLLDASTRYMENLYPAESNHLLEIEELLQPGNHFLGAFIQERAVGCVALITKSSYAEIKRLFVMKSYRRAKIGLQLMQEIESLASRNHIRLLRLETEFLNQLLPHSMNLWAISTSDLLVSIKQIR